MKICVICDREAKLFSKKTLRGYICKDCMQYIPKSVNVSIAETEYLQTVYQKTIEKKERFEATASLGSLYIDSLHGMFCISKKGAMGKPVEYHDVYDISEVDNIGLYCADVRNIGTNSNNVVCNIKFKIVTKEISAEYVICQNKTCPFKVKGKEIEFSEPPELSMFRNMFNQMIDDITFNMVNKLDFIRKAKAELSRENHDEAWARGILFIDEKEDITYDLLKEKRNELVKIFHSDRQTGFEDDKKMAQIYLAYNTLT